MCAFAYLCVRACIRSSSFIHSQLPNALMLIHMHMSHEYVSPMYPFIQLPTYLETLHNHWIPYSLVDGSIATGKDVAEDVTTKT